MYFSIFHSQNGIPAAEIGAILIWIRSHFAARPRGNAIMSPSLLWHTAEGGDQAILRPAGLNGAFAYRDIPFLRSPPARIATEVLAQPKSEANWRDVDTEHLTSNGVVCWSRPVARRVERPLDAQQSAACDNRSQRSLPLLARQKAARIASCPKSGEAWARVFIHHLGRKLRGNVEDAQSVNVLDKLTSRKGATQVLRASLRQARAMRFARRDRASACHGSGRSGAGCRKPVVIRSQHAAA